MARLLFVDKGVPTVGIAYMASYLKESGHDVRYFRSSMKGMFLPNVEFDLFDHIDNELDGKVDVFCFSVMAIDWPWTKEKTTILKKRYPHIPIIAGGAFATTSPEIIINHPTIDYVCCGDGEKPLLDIANSIDKNSLKEDVGSIGNISYRENGEEVIKEMSWRVENLDDYPFPDFTIFEGQFCDAFFQSPGLITSRGCPYTCTYCSAPTMLKAYNKIGGYVRQHGADYMVRFLKQYDQRYGLKSIIFNDDVFFLNKKWLREFAEKYAEHIKIPFSCLGHPFAISEEVSALLKKMNCKLILLGLQSGSEDVRLKVGRKETNELVINACNALTKNDVHFSINHIFDFPWDNEENIRLSASLYNEVRPQLLDVFSLGYFPKSDIVKDAIEMGYLDAKHLDVIESGDSQVEVGSYGTDVNAAATYTRNPSYKRYCFFFVIIPLLPKAWLKKLISDPEKFKKVTSWTSKLPPAFSAFLKLLLACKNGSQFIQFSAIYDWIFYVKKRFQNKTIDTNKVAKEVMPIYPPLRSDQSL